MWKLIEISQQTYFIHCSFNSSQESTFILYDLKEAWCQTLPFHEIKQNVKQLNKRYDFNDDNIKETLLKGNLETATLEQQPHTSSTKPENCVIKLKYRVKNCPFNLEWTLRRQTLEEFQSTFIQPLFSALYGCYQQVEILTDILRKKDAELMQYRKEGAVLHRKTLATKPFDFDEFGQKYQASTELAINFTELAKFVINTKPNVEHANFSRASETKKEENKLDMPHTEEKSSTTNNTINKMSPKQRKRKVQEMKQQQLERQLKVRKHQFEYESSQSQTTNSSNSQTIEDNTKQMEAKDQAQKSTKKETESDSNHATPRRETTRSTPIKNYQEQDCNDDKTDDSESDASNVRSLRERTTSKSTNNDSTLLRTTTRCAPNKNYQEHISNENKTDDSESDANNIRSLRDRTTSRSSNINSTPLRKTTRSSPIKNYQENISNDDKTDDSESDTSNIKSLRDRTFSRSSNNLRNNETSNKEQTSENILKSSLSYSALTKSLHKSSQSSNNVYDFSTDSEYEAPSHVNKTLKASPNTKELQKNRSSQVSKSIMDNESIPTRSSSRVSTSTMDNEIAQPNKSSLCSIPVFDKSKNLSHSSTPIADDISSQLDAIKKELECLEALRLADLKKRICKA